MKHILTRDVFIAWDFPKIKPRRCLRKMPTGRFASNMREIKKASLN